MPLLDVSDAFDVEFLDSINVLRVTQVIDSHGRSQNTTQTYPNLSAVVTPSSPNDLQRVPEGQYMGKAITVYIQNFFIQGPSAGLSADRIVWHGSTYLVQNVSDYSGFGIGFVSVVATSMDATNPPPTGS